MLNNVVLSGAGCGRSARPVLKRDPLGRPGGSTQTLMGLLHFLIDIQFVKGGVSKVNSSNCPPLILTGKSHARLLFIEKL